MLANLILPGEIFFRTLPRFFVLTNPIIKATVSTQHYEENTFIKY